MACLVQLAGAAGCSPFAPSCRDETGPIVTLQRALEPDEAVSHAVVSPSSSNLRITLRWTDQEAVLDVAATIIDSGGHTGCAMLTSRPSPPPTGAAAPATTREILVDGWTGKAYRIDIAADATRRTDYTLTVVYEIRCES